MISQLLWELIAIQVLLGAFDTLYHHELTERLAWRPSQRRELRLHAIRNGIYAILFFTIAWLEPKGAFAIVVLLLLAIEVIITLVDFIEEDATRRLSGSERVTHTLLAMNYGAVLVLLIPALLGWSHLPSTITPTTYGLWSIGATLTGIGVLVFGLRDWLASRRCLRLATRPAAPLVSPLSGRKHILITGATGFIGRSLTEALVAAGHDVTALVRNPNPDALAMRPLRLVTSLDQIPSTEEIDAIVNLAGEPITDMWWTAAKRRRCIDSRVGTTEAVVRLIARLERKPPVLVSGSAVGWYGLNSDTALTETSGGNDCFSRDLCLAWETAALAARTHGVRVALLRIGLVIGTDGGFLTRMLTPFEFGLGGPMGSGKQWMSWIDRDDLVRLIAHVIATPSLDGPINATAPNPVTNAEFSHTLGIALARPAVMAVPAGVLALLGGDLARELLLGGQKVLPAKALASGFIFHEPDLGHALAALLGSPPAATHTSVTAVTAIPKP